MNAKQHIGHIIQERRTQMRITQEQLAEIAQMGINTLFKIEKGDANPTLYSLEKIADVMGLEITLKVKEIPGIGNEMGKNPLYRAMDRDYCPGQSWSLCVSLYGGLAQGWQQTSHKPYASQINGSIQVESFLSLFLQYITGGGQ